MKTTQKLLILFVLVLSVSAFTIKSSQGYKIGDVATDFKLENIDGTMVSLSDFEDAKGFIITFTCNTCPYAIAYEDRVEALNKKYASKGYPVIAIMPNNTTIKPGDNMEAMQKRAKEKGFTFPYLIDAEQDIYPQYGATKTPHIYVLQKTKKGNIVKYIGAIDDNFQDANAVKTKYVEDAVNALLQGNEIKVKETKAIGCSIKA
ncbi:Alkyl hydroperoxide reductase and/or thiol-specific antioxidant family (AhpC/TSA) protein [Mesoflavibacter sp. HG96]|jgi:peroxiredoxin|uniref:thioredoxin family protein n=1 Tax=Mesoflavibacter TaxID=444051 RepID=UPI000D1077E6|nr:MULTISPECIES: thioredoxin family protein [Mesoflavibacter]QIJ88132.1 Alkyl hydroperoxide reductase and/or thiol-specific antioxidant family (AhpC/TSA) protein [Mesoflavibacter sp. HG96]QIJ90860.1 Alkyl hydroperoxide reductase and/or thiol-specific antioxidant family (AhpC/TSA) protein [Mesoflavibacter sp. HG37]